MKKVFITGSSSGLGKKLATTFAERGFDILLHGRNRDKLEDIIADLARFDVECDFVMADLSNQADLNKLIKDVKNAGVTILVNNAAMLCPGLELLKLKDDFVSKSIAVNLFAPILLTKGLLEDIEGVININSIAGIERKKNRTIYCSTKAGLKAFSEVLSLETGSQILDVYISKIKSHPSDFGLDLDYVSGQICSAFMQQQREIILDGRVS